MDGFREQYQYLLANNWILSTDHLRFFLYIDSRGTKVWNMLTLVLEEYSAEFNMIAKYFL